MKSKKMFSAAIVALLLLAVMPVPASPIPVPSDPQNAEGPAMQPAAGGDGPSIAALPSIAHPSPNKISKDPMNPIDTPAPAPCQFPQ